MRFANLGRGECGMTLIELVVAVAIVAIAAGSCYEGLAQRPAQARTTAEAFGGLVREARTLAAVTGDPLSGGTGASISVVRNGDKYIATLYAYRPIAGAATAPVRAVNTPPLQTPTELAIADAGELIEAPFALFFSASGHVSAAGGFTIGTSAPLAAEPPCPLRTGIIIAFIDGVHDQAYVLSCELAQLDLETRITLAR